MIIENAEYTEYGSISAAIDGQSLTIPLDPENRHYAALIASGVEIAAYSAPTPTLDQIRASASMTKREFCRKLLALGILPPDEALSAARGDWPATFAAYTAGMDALASADAQIEWAGTTSVDYAHPMLHGLALVQAGGDTAAATALLDAIFDIA